jgi:hypothetical protein
MSFSGKWMELEIIVLNKTTQTQKNKYSEKHFLSYAESLFLKHMKIEGEMILKEEKDE